MTKSNIAYLGKLPLEYRERFSLYCEGVECARIEGSNSGGIVFFQSESQEEKELWDKKASVEFMNSMKEIPIHSSKVPGMVALVDDEDFERINAIRWNLQISRIKSSGAFSSYYAQNATKRLMMHRVVLGLTDGKIKVDHKDHNGLNNQKSNLRTGTHSQNLSNRPKSRINTTGYKGAYRHGKKFVATISFNDQNRIIGHYNTVEEAARAYDKAAREQWGEFALTNFPSQI